jgi:hypothetical protein
MAGHHKNNSGLQLTRKEWVTLIFGTALALGSFKSDDPWVVIPMLCISGATFILLCIWHGGKRAWRSFAALVLIAALCFIGWRDLHRQTTAPLAVQIKLRPKSTTVIFDQLNTVPHGPPLINWEYPVEFELQFKNIGIYEARNVVTESAVVVTAPNYPRSPALDDEVFAAMKGKMEAVATKDKVFHFSLEPGKSVAKRNGTTFSKASARNINKQTQFLYVVGIFGWEDEEGCKEKEFCEIMEPIDHGKRFAHRLCDGNNHPTTCGY